MTSLLEIIEFHSRPVLGIALAVLFLSLSCSKSTDPATNKPPDNGPVGVLLSGSDTDSALSGTSNHGPYAVPDGEWDGDFVTTRLEAVINPSATVGAVNTALNGVGAKISCMRTGLMFTELVIGALPSTDSAQAICSILVASGAFLSAYPCFDPTAGNGGAVMPDYPASIRITPLEEAKFPAAWNLRDRVAALHSAVTVVVADDFASQTPHPEIPAQTFVPGVGGIDTLLDGNGVIMGNHGFAVAGTIGARFDSIGSTGAFADPSNILRLPCISMTGFGSWAALITELFARLPVSGKFILNTSFGYPPDFSLFPKRRIIEHAFYWRALVAMRQADFLHTQSSGNSGFASPVMFNADYNSPFTLAARFDNPFQMLQGTAVSSADSSTLNTLYAQALVHGVVYGTKLGNVLTVGSSDWSGKLSTFSNLPFDVRMIGENLTLPCAMGDGLCSPAADVPWQGSFDGTSFSSPQVAALAGWLWALSPSLTVDETIGIIKNCYNAKWVDAYKATLSLDHSISTAGIRLSLLDIADANGQFGSDMTFDEKDLKMFLDSILHYETDRGTRTRPWARDHSPFDLNGDGYTGDTSGIPTTAQFDLDINTPPAYSTVDVIPCDVPSSGDTTLNESALTDRDILLYYAYSPLYQGEDSVRAELLGRSCSPFTFVRDSSHTWVSASIDPPVNVWENKESDGSSVTASVAESRDSIPSRCAEPASWTAMASGAFDITGNAIGTQYIVSGTVTLSGQATASSDGYCSIPSRSRGQSGGFVDFVSNSNEFIPYTLSISGNVQPTNTDSGTWAECSISFYIVDSLGTVVGGVLGFNSSASGLPYEKSGVIGLLQPGQRLRLSVSAQENIVTSTVLNSLPPDAKVNIGFALTIGN